MQVPANCPVALNCHHRVNVRMTIYDLTSGGHLGR
jgi:hypothetical protein